MNSYSVSKRCSSCALSEVGIPQEKSKSAGVVCSVLLQAALIRHGAAQEGPHNSPFCFILYSFPTTTINKQPTLFYSILLTLHPYLRTAASASTSLPLSLKIFTCGEFPTLPVHTFCLVFWYSVCYCIASLALGWPTTPPFPHL